MKDNPLLKNAEQLAEYIESLCKTDDNDCFGVVSASLK